MPGKGFERIVMQILGIVFRQFDVNGLLLCWYFIMSKPGAAAD
jgi:hypothetical protein